LGRARPFPILLILQILSKALLFLCASAPSRKFSSLSIRFILFEKSSSFPSLPSVQKPAFASSAFFAV
jgi:hypothetical protein